MPRKTATNVTTNSDISPPPYLYAKEESLNAVNKSIESLQSAVRRQHEESNQSIDTIAGVKQEIIETRQRLADLAAQVQSISDHLNRNHPQ